MIKPVIKYPPGSNWLYIRIYGGSQALEEWLTGPFRELLSEWEKQNLLRLFHFVHFLDPEYHMRLRFFLSDPIHSGIVLNQIQHSCGEMLEEDLIWKIEAGTYEPEYDRYGINRMPLVERWFDVDSHYWLNEISRFAGDGNPGIWKSALRSLDVFLHDFGTNMDERFKIINRSRQMAASLFGITRKMKVDLDEKYRKDFGEFRSVLEGDEEWRDDFLLKRSNDSREIFRQLKESFNSHDAMVESMLLPDLIHMSLNRAFRTRHRMQELVLYDFLGRYYESVGTRGKNVQRKA